MFDSLKVLELATVLAGPSVGQFFAELGASVIKVENLLTQGDVTRTWKVPGEATDDRSAYFTSVNWGKKSILVDLRQERGRIIVRELARQSDVVISSYKPGDDRKLGVDYESLRELNPRLIYGRITGYGPQDDRVGYDAVLQAEAGFMFMNGEVGGRSLKMPVALIDILAAHHLKEGLLLALLNLERTGTGHLVEVSLLDAALSSLANQGTNWLVGGKIPQKKGSAHPNIAPYGDVFTTLEGDEILLAVGTDRQFSSLCDVLNIPEIAADPRYQTNIERVHNRADLHITLSEAVRQQHTATLMTAMQAARIPAGIVQNLAQVFDMEAARRLILDSASLRGVKTYVGPTFTHPESFHLLPPPTAGQHTREILTQVLNYDVQTVAELLQAGAVR
ncbi:CaiB/BaiF CoA-transferase family protein [Chryseolinea sp. T2]|uniref:CaiB/BaiF CoA transferase family protein n=1 Tax=Chryseolinea sp. T2 TaxID=3129255 RepID=UPI003077D5A9